MKDEYDFITAKRGKFFRAGRVYRRRLTSAPKY
jgi:hypothetical protein